jgi:hypothetical protein
MNKRLKAKIEAAREVHAELVASGVNAVLNEQTGEITVKGSGATSK